LIGILAKLPGGTATPQELRLRFERSTHLKRQSFYNALAYIKRRHWVLTDGRMLNLSPDDSWREPEVSIGEKLERSKRETSRLEHIAGSQAEQIEELQSEVENLRNWASDGSNSVAVEHLTKIVSDTSATVRQRIRACTLLLNYRSDHDTSAFARSFLEKVVSDPATPVDHRLEGLEQLRRAAGDPQLRPVIEKLTPPAPPVDPVKEKMEREAEHLRKRQHIERQAALDQEELKREWERLSMSNGRPDLVRD
jgi:hypothetical protein